MNRFSKTLLVMAVLFSTFQIALADRGVGKKNKTKTVLNIKTPASLRNSISLNLKSGLSYKGSLLASTQAVNGSIFSTSLVTYQKGNTTYIIPQKSKIIVPDMKQGYAGMKFIIRSK